METYYITARNSKTRESVTILVENVPFESIMDTILNAKWNGFTQVDIERVGDA